MGKRFQVIKNDLKNAGESLAAAGRGLGKGIAYGALTPFDIIDGKNYLVREVFDLDDERRFEESAFAFVSLVPTSVFEGFLPLLIDHPEIYGVMLATNAARCFYSVYNRAKKQ